MIKNNGVSSWCIFGVTLAAVGALEEICCPEEIKVGTGNNFMMGEMENKDHLETYVIPYNCRAWICSKPPPSLEWCGLMTQYLRLEA